jgi:signal transduction histidine kinase
VSVSRTRTRTRTRTRRWRSFSSLAFSLVLFVFVVLFAAAGFSAGVVLVLQLAGVVDFSGVGRDEPQGARLAGPVLFIGLCVFLGTTTAAFFSRRALRPIRRVIEAMRRVAGGDFQVRVDLKGVDELEELSDSFNKMTQELASIETLRSDFVNDFSHEFKTPINSLRGFAQLLREGEVPPAVRDEYLDIIITESDRLARLSTNILALSKYESIGILTDRATFRLDEQIRRVVLLAEPNWAARQVSFDIEMDDVPFRGNEELCEQVWVNLIDNAVKFSPHGAEIRVRCWRQPDGVRVVVADGGIGMSGPTQDRIFDKFYQADPSRASAGSGLGLAIVKRIVDLHQGTIEVASQPGQGTTVTVGLPDPR